MTRDEEIAWAAGLFEGEGCFVTQRGTHICAKLNMTDRDVVERFARIVGGGQLRISTAKSGKPIYEWELNAVQDMRDLIGRFMPYLGDRRRKRALELLAHAADNRGAPGLRTHCINGHPFSGANLYVDPAGRKRDCRECRRARSRKFYLRHKAQG